MLEKKETSEVVLSFFLSHKFCKCSEYLFANVLTEVDGVSI